MFMPGIFNITFLKNSIQTLYNKIKKKIKDNGNQQKIKKYYEEITKFINSLKTENDINSQKLSKIVDTMKGALNNTKSAYTGDDIENKNLQRCAAMLAGVLYSLNLKQDLVDDLDRIHESCNKDLRNFKNEMKKWSSSVTDSPETLNMAISTVLLWYRFMMDLRSQIKNTHQDYVETLNVAQNARSGEGYQHPGMEKLSKKEIKIFDVNASGQPVFDGGDVVQVRMDFGDCWLLSALRSMAENNPEILKKCFKHYPNNGIWTLGYGELSVRAFEINNIGEPIRKKIINVRPDKFLKGVNTGRNDLPVWPRILELAAQSCMYNFELLNQPDIRTSIGDGYQELFAYSILAGKAKSVKTETFTFSPNDPPREAMNNLAKLLGVTRSHSCWSITTSSPKNPGHAVAVTGFSGMDGIETEPYFNYFDQGAAKGKEKGKFKIFEKAGGRQMDRVFTVSYYNF